MPPTTDNVTDMQPLCWKTLAAAVGLVVLCALPAMGDVAQWAL